MSEMALGRRIPEYDVILGDGCTSGDPWMWQSLHQCVEGPQQFIGFVFGIMAIAVWLILHVLFLRLRHEEYSSAKTKSSFLILLHITLPDCLSLVGAAMSKQLTSQVLLACYLVLADAFFWLYFAIIKSCLGGEGRCCNKCKGDKYKFIKDSNMNNLIFMTPFMVSFIYITTWFGLDDVTPRVALKHGSGAPMMTHRTRILLEAEESKHEQMWPPPLIAKIGYGLGSTAIVLTWTALLHQSQWVFHEKKVPFAHYVIHMLMIIADVFYLISIFTQSVETGFLMHTFPWTFARMGTIGLNLGILFQTHLNKRKRIAGHEIGENVAMVLRNKDDDDADDTDEEVAEIRPLIEAPKKNKYLRKMRRIARQLDHQERGESTDSDFSDDDRKKVAPPLEGELDLDLEDETLNYELTSEEVYNILAAEDRQETVISPHHNPAVLHIDSTFSSTDENDTVLFFNAIPKAPPVALAGTNSDVVRRSSVDHHQVVGDENGST